MVIPKIIGPHFHWFDQENKTIVCPIKVDDLDETLKNLDALGGKILGQIEMPIDLLYHFYHYKLPDNFSLYIENEEDEELMTVYQFVDENLRARLRTTVSSIFLGTNIWNRFHLHQDLTEDNSDLIFYVDDLNRHIKDESPRYVFQSLNEEDAIDWLDENYPDWKNPSKYWDDFDEKTKKVLENVDNFSKTMKVSDVEAIIGPFDAKSIQKSPFIAKFGDIEFWFTYEQGNLFTIFNERLHTVVKEF